MLVEVATPGPANFEYLMTFTGVLEILSNPLEEEDGVVMSAVVTVLCICLKFLA